MIRSLFVFAQDRSGGIHGRITDSASKEPIATAQITALNTDYGTISDENGYYYLALPKGKYEIQVQMVGYRSDTLVVELLSDKLFEWNVSLKMRPYQGERVVVVGSVPNSFQSIMDLGLNINSFVSSPALGEMDVLRVIQTLPGVVIASDYSSMLYIRGSPPDQTQINFDDVPILNPYHLGNVFSAFNTDGARTVEFLPGINSAQYGGYLGGKVNIVPKVGGDVKQYKVKISASLLSSTLSFGGKLDSVEYFFAGRRNYFDLIWKKMGDDPPYYFYDLQGSIAFPINRNQSMFIQTFYSQDVLCDILDHDEEKIKGLTQPRWGNRIISLKWQNNIDKDYSINSHVYYSSGKLYSNTLHNDMDNNMKDIACRLNINRKHINHYFQTGIECKYLLYDYDWFIEDSETSELSNLIRPPQSVFFDNAPPVYSKKREKWQFNFYFQDEYRIDVFNSIVAGIRFTWFDMGKKLGLEPRIQLKRILTENLKLSAMYARHLQYFYTLKNQQTASIFAPFTIYFPINESENPLSSNCFSCGVSWEKTQNAVLKAEAYCKTMQNIPVFSDIYPYKLITQNQLASGLDLFFERYGWKGMDISANYSLNYTQIKQGEKKYPAGYDRRHNLKLMCKYHQGKGWNVEIVGYFLSGLPYTPVVGKYPDNGGRKPTDELYVNLGYEHGYEGWSFVHGDKNSLRFPPYHRIDIGTSKTWLYRKYRLTFKFQIMNVYNNKNPLLYVYEDEDTTQPRIVKQFNLPIVPSFQINFEF